MMRSRGLLPFFSTQCRLVHSTRPVLCSSVDAMREAALSTWRLGGRGASAADNHESAAAGAGNGDDRKRLGFFERLRRFTGNEEEAGDAAAAGGEGNTSRVRDTRSPFCQMGDPDTINASRSPHSDPAGDRLVAGVPWCVHERTDFYLTFWAPAGWQVREVVRENAISVQVSPPVCVPPPAALNQLVAESAAPLAGTSSSFAEPQSAITAPPTASMPSAAPPPLHGISITAFAYHRRVAEPDPVGLLAAFIRRFLSSVDPQGFVPDAAGRPHHTHRAAGHRHATGMDYNIPAAIACDGHARGMKGGAPGSGAFTRVTTSSTSDVRPPPLPTHIAQQLGGAACELVFTPRVSGTALKEDTADAGAGPVQAKALLRAFYHPGRRFHYVVVAAVPQHEYEFVQDILAHAVGGVRGMTGGDSSSSWL